MIYFKGWGGSVLFGVKKRDGKPKIAEDSEKEQKKFYNIFQGCAVR
jgi:hypothetical protein